MLKYVVEQACALDSVGVDTDTKRFAAIGQRGSCCRSDAVIGLKD